MTSSLVWDGELIEKTLKYLQLGIKLVHLDWSLVQWMKLSTYAETGQLVVPKQGVFKVN